MLLFLKFYWKTSNKIIYSVAYVTKEKQENSKVNFVTQSNFFKHEIQQTHLRDLLRGKLISCHLRQNHATVTYVLLLANNIVTKFYIRCISVQNYLRDVLVKSKHFNNVIKFSF